MKAPKRESFTDMSWQEKYDFDLSWLITEVRIRKGWTQDKLATKTGLLQPSIARAESGATRPSHQLLKKITEAAGLKLHAPSLTSQKNSNS